jgi:hypothetical protein
MAILVRALEEARAGDREALCWLAGEDCQVFCEVLGVDRRVIHDLVDLWADRPALVKTKGKIVIRIGV